MHLAQSIHRVPLHGCYSRFVISFIFSNYFRFASKASLGSELNYDFLPRPKFNNDPLCEDDFFAAPPLTALLVEAALLASKPDFTGIIVGTGFAAGGCGYDWPLTSRVLLAALATVPPTAYGFRECTLMTSDCFIILVGLWASLFPKRSLSDFIVWAWVFLS